MSVQVSLSSIEKAIQKVDNLNDDALERMSETCALAQPDLLAYLMSAALEYENERLEGLIIYYFCLIHEAYVQEGAKLNQVSNDDIDEIEEPFFEVLDRYFDTENDELLDDFCEQPNLTKFMAMEVSTKDEDGTELDDETATQLFIVSISLIALLNNSQA